MSDILPEGCGYQGYEFGASYPDSQCFGGRLYDMDACDNHGNIYEPTDDIPCPMCNADEAVAYWTRQNLNGGMSALSAVKTARHLVNDIRQNRQNGAEPWKAKR